MNSKIIIKALAFAALAVLASRALAQCECCQHSPDEGSGAAKSLFYRAEGCGMSFGAAEAKENNYICPMDGSRLVPTRKAAFGTVSFSTTPWPAKAGKTTVQVRLLGQEKRPLRGASASMTLRMPGMTMEGDDDAVRLREGKEGIYTAPANLSMRGRWLATVTVKNGGKPETFGFEFEVK